jgi:SHS2 domain-containing protein
MPYRFLDDVATADIAFQAWGETLEETFIASADAAMNVMVENLESIVGRETHKFHLESEALDLLLFDLLQELIYLKDSRTLLLRVREIQIQEENAEYHLSAVVEGETLDARRHEQRVDVKAVTLHQFCLEKRDRGWLANVILDI